MSNTIEKIKEIATKIEIIELETAKEIKARLERTGKTERIE